MTVISILRTAFRDLKHDLKATRWLRGLAWSVGVIWFFGLIVSAILVGILSDFISTSSACLPDGRLRLRTDTYSMWSSSGFFQITLGGGKLTFAQAKVVDIVWDIGVGRGGQLLLAVISWRVFARYLTVCMESEPVSYRVFRTIFIESDASVLSTCRTIKSFVRQRRLRSKAAMTFMAATMMFIIAFPTLMSAMSGYDANVGSRILDSEDNLIPFSNYTMAIYKIHDAWRIDLDRDHWVMMDEFGTDPVLSPSPSCGSSINNYTSCKFISDYVVEYGIGGTLDQKSTLHGPNYEKIELDAPVLNISVYAVDDKSLGGQNSSELQNSMWVRNNVASNKTTIELHGKCQNTGDYKWGFSFLQLFVCIIFLLAWTTGIYIMWIYTHYTMQLRRRVQEEVSGEYRAVLELAAAMQKELDLQYTDLSVLREQQLKDRIAREIHGGAVAYAYSHCPLMEHSMRSALSTWFKREKWWFLCIFVVSSVYGTVWIPSASMLWISFWLISVWFGQILAFCIGSTAGSRLLIISFWSSVGGIVVVTIEQVYYAQYRSSY